MRRFAFAATVCTALLSAGTGSPASAADWMLPGVVSHAFNGIGSARINGTDYIGVAYELTLIANIADVRPAVGRPWDFEVQSSITQVAVGPPDRFWVYATFDTPLILYRIAGAQPAVGVATASGARVFELADASLAGVDLQNGFIGDFLTPALVDETMVFSTVEGPLQLRSAASSLRFQTLEGFFLPTPEPASWVMLIVGFGLTGAAMRRRRQFSAPGA